MLHNDTADNFIGPVDQSNDADGSGDADFTQNNNIPTINQVIVAENDCDQSDEQSADGANFAICSNFDAFNNIDFNNTDKRCSRLPMSMIFSRTILVHFLKS